MKHFLPFLTCMLLCFSPFVTTTHAQAYNATDVAALKNLLNSVAYADLLDKVWTGTDQDKPTDINDPKWNGTGWVNSVSVDWWGGTTLKDFIWKDKGIKGDLTFTGFNHVLYLKLNGNEINTLTVNGLPALTAIECYDNELTSLIVSGSTALESLLCYENKITSLDVSALTNLQYLHCQDNLLASLNVASLAKVKTIDCYKNKLQTLEVKGLQNLKALRVYNNQLTSLVVEDLPALETIECENNKLAKLIVPDFTALILLRCYNNLIASLDVSALTNLKYLECNDNLLTSLDVANLAKAETIDCYNNLLQTLEVKGLQNLKALRVYNNQLTSLVVEDLPVLELLNCKENYLPFHVVADLETAWGTIPEFYYAPQSLPKIRTWVGGIINMEALKLYDPAKSAVYRVGPNGAETALGATVRVPIDWSGKTVTLECRRTGDLPDFSTDPLTMEVEVQTYVPPTPSAPPAPTLYKVNLSLLLDNPDLSGCVTLYPAAGEYEVEAGQSMTVLVFLNDDCDLSDVKMTFNGDTIVPEEKKNDLRAIAYTFRFPITGETELKVIGVEANEKSNPTGSSTGPSNLPQGEAKVWSTPGYIHVSSPKGGGQEGAVCIYTITGQLVAKERITSPLSPLTFHLPKGIYLLVIGDETFKVRVTD